MQYAEALFTGSKEDSESGLTEGAQGEICSNLYCKVTFKRNSTVRELKESESEQERQIL